MINMGHHLCYLFHYIILLMLYHYYLLLHRCLILINIFVNKFVLILEGIFMSLFEMHLCIVSIINKIYYLLLILCLINGRFIHRQILVLVFSLLMSNLLHLLSYLFFYQLFWKPFKESPQSTHICVQTN